MPSAEPRAVHVRRGMKWKLNLAAALCYGLMGSLAGCRKAEVPAAPTESTSPAATPPTANATARDSRSQASAGSPSLIVLEQQGEVCNWSVLQPPQLDAKGFLVTRTCPFNNGLVWDRNGGRFFFAIARWLYLYDWQTAKVEKVAPNPIGRDDPELGIAANGVLRLCDYQERPIEVDVEVGFRVTMELQPDGSWNNVADVRMEDGKALEPCSGPRDAMASGGVFYEPQPLAVATCPQGTVTPATAECPSSLVTDFLPTQVNMVNDGFEYVALGGQVFLAYPTMHYGDEKPFPIPPLFAITNTVTTLYDRSFQEDAEMDLAFSSDYFVARAARDLTNPILFKKGELEPAKEFPETARVFWIPGTIAGETVVRVPPEPGR